jgi:hypothetical protein
MSDANPPAANPCGSCPYRRDVPSGVWSPEEYDKLPEYDNDTGEQPFAIFMCHRQDNRVCAGWAGCHDMEEAIAVRIARPELAEALLDYSTDTPLWDSGLEAAEHGRRDVGDPDRDAQRIIDKLSPTLDAQAIAANSNPELEFDDAD